MSSEYMTKAEAEKLAKKPARLFGVKAFQKAGYRPFDDGYGKDQQVDFKDGYGSTK